MGTTLTAVDAGDGTAVVVGHVGDSRAYLLRDGELRQITNDHSLVEELVATDDSPSRRSRGPPAAVDHHARARDRRQRRRRRLPGPARGRRPGALSAPTGSPTCCAPTDIGADAPPARPTRTRVATRLVDAANAAGGEDNITRRDRRRGRRRRSDASRHDCRATRVRDRRPRCVGSPRSPTATRFRPTSPPPTACRRGRLAQAHAGKGACGASGRATSASSGGSIPVLPDPRDRGRRDRLVRPQQLLRRCSTAGRVTVYQGVPGRAARLGPDVDRRTQAHAQRPAAGRRAQDVRDRAHVLVA